VEESSMLATGAAGRRLQHPGCGRRMKKNEISLQKSMEFLF